MMKSKKTRFLSLMLAAALLLTTVNVPTAVFADNGDGMFCLYNWGVNKTVSTVGSDVFFDLGKNFYQLNGNRSMRDVLELGELRFDYRLINNNADLNLSNAFFWGFKMKLSFGGTIQFVVIRIGPLKASNSSFCFHQALP